MDDKEKKLFAQLDDPMAGQRSGALELLHLYDEKNKTSFRDRLAKIERGEKYDELEQETAALRQELAKELQARAAVEADLAQHKGAVAQWQRAYNLQRARLVTANAIAWGRTTGRKLAAYIGVPLIAIGA